MFDNNGLYSFYKQIFKWFDLDTLFNVMLFEPINVLAGNKYQIMHMSIGNSVYASISTVRETDNDEQ